MKRVHFGAINEITMLPAALPTFPTNRFTRRLCGLLLGPPHVEWARFALEVVGNSKAQLENERRRMLENGGRLQPEALGKISYCLEFHDEYTADLLEFALSAPKSSAMISDLCSDSPRHPMLDVIAQELLFGMVHEGENGSSTLRARFSKEEKERFIVELCGMRNAAPILAAIAIRLMKSFDSKINQAMIEELVANSRFGEVLIVCHLACREAKNDPNLAASAAGVAELAVQALQKRRRMADSCHALLELENLGGRYLLPEQEIGIADTFGGIMQKWVLRGRKGKKEEASLLKLIDEIIGSRKLKTPLLEQMLEILDRFPGNRNDPILQKISNYILIAIDTGRNELPELRR